jgi:predicted transcriptional regulator
MSIVLSIKPKFTNLILDGSKTIEMRTKIGKKFVSGASVIIYSSSPVKAIVATAKIHRIQHLTANEVNQNHLKKIHISREFFTQYMENRKNCYLIEFSDINKLKQPISLAELKKLNFTAPQSFCYTYGDIEELVMSSL